MNRLDRRRQLFALGLAATAGYVDAVAFVQVGGFFVSFMSGNSTRLGVGVAEYSIHALQALLLIFSFVAGVVAGSVLARKWPENQFRATLSAAAGILALAAVAGEAGLVWIAAVAMAASMGIVNTAFQEEGASRFGVTYMTGALVQVGQCVSRALHGGELWAFVPFLVLWLALVLGAIVGAATSAYLGIGAIWVASSVIAGLAMLKH